MAHRFVFATALAVFLTCFGMVTSPTLAGNPPLVMKGLVEISSSLGGPVTTVTMDLGQELHSPDGIVDQAFRVQQLDAAFVRYSGPATVTYSKTALVVETADHGSWVFALPGATTPVPVSASAVYYLAIGISRFQGARINRSSSEVTSTLLTTGCGLSAIGGADPLCSGTCPGGGAGTDGCSISCGLEGGCNANCMAGSHACCSCVNGCGCCPDKESQPHAGTATPRPAPHAGSPAATHPR
jgi:hypothetical protein